MKILICNPGSTSLKFKLWEMPGEKMLAQGRVERIGKELLTAKGKRKAISTNIDFYSGFVYEMLGLPKELYTPLFAIARMAGWSAHRMEELGENSKIIRPACKCIEKRRPYVPMSER